MEDLQIKDYFKSKYTGQQIEDIIEKLNNDDIILLDLDDNEESLVKFWEKFNSLEFNIENIKKIIIRYYITTINTNITKAAVVLYFTINDVFKITNKYTIHTNKITYGGAKYSLIINEKLKLSKDIIFTDNFEFKIIPSENDELIFTNIVEIKGYNDKLKYYLENKNYEKLISIIDLNGDNNNIIFDNITKCNGINYLKGYNYTIGDKSDYSEFYMLNFSNNAFVLGNISFTIIIPVENNELIIDDMVCNLIS